MRPYLGKALENTEAKICTTPFHVFFCKISYLIFELQFFWILLNNFPIKTVFAVVHQQPNTICKNFNISSSICQLLCVLVPTPSVILFSLEEKCNTFIIITSSNH